MKCPRCGTELPSGFSFCTHCGEPLAGVADAPAADPAPIRPVPRPAAPRPAPQKQRPRWPLYVVIALLAALLVGMCALLVHGLLTRDDEDDDDDRDRERTAYVEGKKEEASSTEEPAEPSVEPSEEPSPTPTPTPTATPAPTSSPADEGDVRIAVTNYLTAFINDVNNERYDQLTAYVQSGSAMEAEHRDFLNKSIPKAQRESLLESQITDVRMQSKDCYYVTSVEKYEIWENEDPYHWWIHQRCTYQVNRQSDGTWKIAAFVGKIEKLDSGVY